MPSRSRMIVSATASQVMARAVVEGASAVMSLPRIADYGPPVIGIECRDLLDKRRRFRPQILFVDGPILVHDEGHDACAVVFGRHGDQPEAADHVAVDDV